MILKNKNRDLPSYYCFDNLSSFSELVHGVFTREGGISKDIYSSLNVGASTGDNTDNVYANRKLVAKAMGVDEDKAIYLNQVHEKEFVVLRESQSTKEITNKGITNKDITNLKADGIITNVKGLLAVMQVADCQAIILYDPVNKVIANIHSGWRGSILNIIGRGVEIMTEQFYTRPSDIIASIAPSLGPCCAEFKNYRNEIPDKYWKYRNGEFHFDFWEISREQLIEKGVKGHNIEIAKICTTCSSYIFYSYRKENVTGRFAVAVKLKYF